MTRRVRADDMFDPELMNGLSELQLNPMDLWLRYFALGGKLDATTVDAYLNGLVDVADIDHDVITHVLNELYTDQGRNSPFPYFRP
jgi:hypothetical protein